MDELEERLKAVLEDPEAMAEISRLASGLMGGEETVPESPAAGLPPGLRELLRSVPAGGHPLAKAIGPYLPEERKRRLEKALGIAAAARLAGGMLGEGGEDHGL